MIVLENQGLTDIYGPAPFLTGFANQHSLATNWSAVSHPSEPNYIAMAAADTLGTDGTDSCSTRLSQTNIVDLLEPAGRKWSAYFEGYQPGGNACSAGSLYHAAYLMFNNILNNSARIANIHPFSTTSPGNLIAELNSASPSNFIWVNPDNNHNMHDNGVLSGDSYMSVLIPQILGTATFTARKAVLMVTFDEGNSGYPDDFVYTCFSGPSAKPGFKSSAFHSHYSLCATLETLWGLGSLGRREEAPATEFFQ